ncbi:MAG: LLM class flavin-dependent oxidoreductase [Actinomycetota bacterium]|nr:LLM class flavin-dependent oxidoreductase [Actinomycetota bacterium]
MSTEIWISDGGRAGQSTADRARHIEDDGWDGYSLGDSHTFAPDPYPLLGAAAAATSRLKLGTWVTNPATRHAAVTAAAIGAVQSESGGRAHLGIARGDSPLAHLGLAPSSPKAFEAYLSQLQHYLRGEIVDHTSDNTSAANGAGVAARTLDQSNILNEEGRPTQNRLQWIHEAGPKVPIDVAASGPKVIQLAARVADRMTFAVGADLERLAWAKDIATKEMAAAGRTGEVGLGACVQVVVAPTRDEGREIVSGGVVSYARFAVMHGKVTGPVSAATKEALENVHQKYNMNDHVLEGAEHARNLPAETIDAFAVTGPVDHCVERLRGMIDMGLSRLLLFHGAFRSNDPDARRESDRLLAHEVLPALR